MKPIASLKRQVDNRKDSLKFKTTPVGVRNPKVRLAFSKDAFSPNSLPEETQNLTTIDELTRARNCVSQITDPLWQNICTDLITMMGPASVLKIWNSTLGECTRQDKVLNITCKTVETSAFVQQYDFVVLGSLQRYFPALKQLRVHTTAAPNT